jgi:dienelactone hydrolase
VTYAGVYGFCWGAKMAVLSTKLVGPAGIIHPAFLQTSDAAEVYAPILLIDTKDEDKAAMEEFIGEVKKKPFGDKVVHKRYDDMFHGFCAGRANYGDDANGKRAKEVDPILTLILGVYRSRQLFQSQFILIWQSLARIWQVDSRRRVKIHCYSLTKYTL